MAFRFRIVPVALLTLACSSTVLAQRQEMSADEKEILAYVLRMDTLKKVLNATRAAYKEVMKDPKFKQIADLEAEIKKLEERGEKLDDGLPEAEQERLESLKEKKEALEDSIDGPTSSAETLAELEASVRKIPAFAAALQREGVSPREYSKFWMAFWSAGLAHGFQKTGYGSKEMTSLVNPANLKFFSENEKEIEAVMKEFEFLDPKK